MITQSGQYFLQALAALSWQDDELAFEPQEVEWLMDKAEEMRKRSRASHLGVKHLESAFRALYKYDHDATNLNKVRAKAKALEQAWREKHAGEFVPYERGGGFTVKAQ